MHEAGRVDTLVLRADGRILIGGLFAEVNGLTRNRLAQLKQDGSLDADFTPDISGFEDGPFLFDSVFSIVPLADGKVLVGGDFSAVDGLPRSGIARLHADIAGEGIFRRIQGEQPIIAQDRFTVLGLKFDSQTE